MTWDVKVGTQEQDQRTYENAAEARRVVGVGSDGTIFGSDALTTARPVIDYPHSEIHSGSMYSLIFVGIVAKNESKIFAFTTPDTTKWSHLVVEVSCSAAGEWELREDAVVTGGSVVTPVNRNRNSSNTSDWTVVVEDPTISTPGSFVDGDLLNAGGKVGDDSRSIEEWILKQNSVHTVEFSTSDANSVTIKLTWYEHTNR